MRERIGLTCEPVRLRLRRPLAISRGAQEEATVLHVTLHWRGHVGFGEAAPQEDEGATVADARAFLDAIASDLGRDPFAMEAIMRRATAHGGPRAAHAALDAALHDLVGKVLGVPTWRLLGLGPGGPATTYTVSLDDPEAMGRQAAEAVERFPSLQRLKVKLGAGDGHDVERARAVARARRPLSVDANGAWTLDEALATIPHLHAAGVDLVEQPLAPGSEHGPDLRARSPLPVYVDEDCHTLADVAACARRAHGINIKLVKCGGIREALRMVHAARALGLGVMLGCMVESGLGIAAAVQLSSLVDAADLDGNLLLDRDPSPGVRFIDGVQTASDRPGLGLAA